MMDGVWFDDRLKAYCGISLHLHAYIGVSLEILHMNMYDITNIIISLVHNNGSITKTIQIAHNMKNNDTINQVIHPISTLHL
jgi:hypothetical protein